jgi:riboflavin synthase
MFTGIVEETGVVDKVGATQSSIRLVLKARSCARRIKVGDSLAVNGCCLTVARIIGQGGRRRLAFDLLHETCARTNLQFLRSGSLVNLERALRADGRVDGHFVTGHVDGVGTISRWERVGGDHLLEVETPADLMRHVVLKGSIAVDGISLTVAAIQAKRFRVWIIPHTYAVTALRERKRGDKVNLETDLLGKYAERFAKPFRR